MDDFHQPITQGFGLNKAGEQVFLSYLPGTIENRVVDAIKFKGVENETTLSRSPDGSDDWIRTLPSPGTANGQSLADLVITEMMVQPAQGEDSLCRYQHP